MTSFAEKLRSSKRSPSSRPRGTRRSVRTCAALPRSRRRHRVRQTIVLLHGGGPGASSWSNFSKNIAVLARALSRAGRRSARLRPLRQAHRARAVQPVQRDGAAEPVRPSRHRTRCAGGQFARRRHRGPLRARQPEAGGPAGADGPGRAERQPVRTRPDRGRQAARQVHQRADPREHGEVPAHHGLRPEAGHPGAHRRTVRHRQSARVAGRRQGDGKVVRGRRTSSSA